MKKLFTITLAVCIAAVAFAQPRGGQHERGGKPDFDKIRAEKVAYITSEVGLTSKEAEAFWPVYNRIEEDQQQLMKAEREASKALHKALAEGQDTKALLDAYLKAKDANVNLQVKNVKDYRKILPEEKVAKFYVCEEKFLRNQLGKLGGDRGPAHGRGHGDVRRGRGERFPQEGKQVAPAAE